MLEKQPKPVCAALMPFTIVELDADAGFVKVEFLPQPAFGNHFGNIQGGFAVAMLDAPISCAVFAKLRQWLPTVEIKASFVAPARIGKCIGEGRVIRAGRSVAFVEGKIWTEEGELAVHGTATVLVKPPHSQEPH
ncbi:hypothetical protein GCM10027034_14050 [Ramlibacter solisilvae]